MNTNNLHGTNHISPATFELYDNYPNPFNNQTLIKFSLEKSSWIELRIIDTQGKIVNTITKGNYSKGIHLFKWDGRTGSGHDVASGMYLFQLKRGKGIITKRMMLVK